MLRVAILVVAAVFFAGMGVYGLVAPARLVAPFLLRAETSEGRSEVRAVYGGFGIAVAGLLGWASVADPGGVSTGVVVTVGVALGGMAFGRIVSRIVDPATPFYPVGLYLLVEAVGAAGLLAVA
ncbi:DUF4345 family protein [Nocardia aurea]|uniref:DUF4345 family protein n=1 Tax=Nocardia aurea TaxID=2144174 RepID=UPI003F4D5775